MPGDVAYIVDTWVGSATKLPGVAVLGERPSFQLTWRSRQLLIRHGARVACDVVDPDTIMGWACVVPATTWHVALFLWAYVRDDFRGQGIAKALVSDLTGEVVSATKGAANKLPAGWKHMDIAERWAMEPH